MEELDLLKDMRLVLENGADKVAVNTGAFNNPKLITDCANYFGRQCVILSLDARQVKKTVGMYLSMAEKLIPVFLQLNGQKSCLFGRW